MSACAIVGDVLEGVAARLLSQGDSLGAQKEHACYWSQACLFKPGTHAALGKAKSDAIPVGSY